METLFFRQWRLFALAVGMIVVLGSSALLTIGRQEDPTITNLFATIITPFPGAEPGTGRGPGDREDRGGTAPDPADQRNPLHLADRDFVGPGSSSRPSCRTRRSNRSGRRCATPWPMPRSAFPSGVPEPEFDDDRTGAFTAISAIRPAPGGSGRQPRPAAPLRRSPAGPLAGPARRQTRRALRRSGTRRSWSRSISDAWPRSD